jgi:uncharacterized DUF497 family protein
VNIFCFWDENKRQSNLEKHGLDFMDADLVLAYECRIDLPSAKNGEQRVQSFAYVFEVLTVLRLVFLPGEDGLRIISFPQANRTEKEAYYDWL